MMADLSHALASVLSTVEHDQLGYVLYRDPKVDRRIVVLVEGTADAQAFEAVLRSAGAETAPQTDVDDGRDFVLRAASEDGTDECEYRIEIRAGSGKATIANLLWLAATDAGGAAARRSIKDRS